MNLAMSKMKQPNELKTCNIIFTLIKKLPDFLLFNLNIQRCNKKQECDLSIEHDFSGICDCTKFKYLSVKYTCVENLGKQS